MGFFDRYPYTNWHNVNLDWVLERVKEWGQMVEANNQAFQDLEAANESFKEYVTNYLQDLDVQEAINDKIDQMFESGELTAYFQPYVSTVVTNWLEDNITEPEGVVIDSSLTVARAAADSKAAGDKIFANTLSILSNGITGDIRDALLQCFENVAWVNTQGQLLYNYLKNALSATGYIKMHWNTETDNEICIKIIQKAPNSATVDGVATCVVATNVRRGVVLLNVGASTILNQDLTDSGYYPIPIPDNATKVRISSPDSNYLFWAHERKYNGMNHIFSWVAGLGEISNPYTVDIVTHDTQGKANMLLIFCKKQNDEQINELPEIDILFMEN